MEITLYSGINLFCILVVAIILANNNKLKNSSPSGKAFRAILYGSISLFIIDFIWGLLYSDVKGNGDALEWLMNTLYYASIFSIGILWIIYVSNVIEEPIRENPRGMKLLTALIAIMAIFLIVAYLTHWMFYTDTIGDNFNWAMFVIFVLMLILPLLTMGGYVIYKMYKIRIRTYRHEYLTAMIFVVPVIICDIFNILWVNVPMFSIGLTLGIVIMYYNMQNNMITLDSLTQINNRSSLERYFAEVSTKENLNGRHLYFALMDLDHFRAINDKFGYDEGDNALKIVAKILKEACGNRDCFLGRLGGDEFVAIQIHEDRSIIDEICRNIERISVETSKDLEYTIGISVGIIEMEGEMTIHKMVDLGDAEMFKVKQERRKKETSG